MVYFAQNKPFGPDVSRRLAGRIFQDDRVGAVGADGADHLQGAAFVVDLDLAPGGGKGVDLGEGFDSLDGDANGGGLFLSLGADAVPEGLDADLALVGGDAPEEDPGLVGDDVDAAALVHHHGVTHGGKLFGVDADVGVVVAPLVGGELVVLVAVQGCFLDDADGIRAAAVGAGDSLDVDGVLLGVHVYAEAVLPADGLGGQHHLLGLQADGEFGQQIAGFVDGVVLVLLQLAGLDLELDGGVVVFVAHRSQNVLLGKNSGHLPYLLVDVGQDIPKGVSFYKIGQEERLRHFLPASPF